MDKIENLEVEEVFNNYPGESQATSQKMAVQSEWIGKNQSQSTMACILIAKPSWLPHSKNFIEVSSNLKVIEQ